MVILDPSKTEKEHEKMLVEIKNIFSDGGLEFVEEDVWGLRKLAYKIKGFTSGYYVVMNFEGEGKEMPKINKELGLLSQAGLVRYMLQKMPEDYALMRYDRKEESSAAKLSEHAEELQKKVTKSATKKTEKVEDKKEEEKEDSEEKVEEKKEEKEEEKRKKNLKSLMKNFKLSSMILILTYKF